MTRERYSESLAQLRRRWVSESDHDFMQEIRWTGIGPIGFRQRAPYTQARLDRHFAHYRSHCARELPSGATNAQIDEVAFPFGNYESLYALLDSFMLRILIVRKLDLTNRNSMHYHALARYRASMMFWISHIYVFHHDGESPERRAWEAMSG